MEQKHELTFFYLFKIDMHLFNGTLVDCIHGLMLHDLPRMQKDIISIFTSMQLAVTC